jgi:hypothetical protein
MSTSVPNEPWGAFVPATLPGDPSVVTARRVFTANQHRAMALRVARGLLALVSAFYFLRPAEWYPPLVGLPLYQLVMAPCLLLAFSRLTREMSWKVIQHRPIHGCIVGLYFIAVCSNFLHPHPDEYELFAVRYGKTLLYYLLIVVLLNSNEHLSKFYDRLSAILAVLGLLVILANHGLLPFVENAAISDGGVVRAQAVGGAMFDPNDLALLMVLGTFASSSMVLGDGWRRRALGVLQCGCLLYCLILTQSRGGALGLLVGLMALAAARWGVKAVALAGVIALPLLGAAFAGRMTDVSAVSSGTGQSRIQLWTTAIVYFRENPLLGIGPDNFPALVGIETHNSYLQAYAELGLLGGVLFLMPFVFSMRLSHQLLTSRKELLSPESRGLIATNVANTAGIGTCIFALSHHFYVSTYLVMALNCATFANHESFKLIRKQQFSLRTVSHYILIGVAFIIAAHILSTSLVRW